LTARLSPDGHDARRSAIDRAARCGLREPRVRRLQRKDDRLVRPRLRAVDLDQLRHLDGAARADPAQRLVNCTRPFFPGRRVDVTCGKLPEETPMTVRW